MNYIKKILLKNATGY